MPLRLAVLAALLAAAPALAQQPAPTDTVAATASPANGGTWDVTAPFGPTREVAFTTTEGTWMSLDVSPDGREIVFDLLGDLYLLPISGGEARQLTQDAAWNVQPRFSPDGRRIAFTSDREGGDNVFVMDRDGSNSRAVTNEDFRLLNNPFWTPDGEYIVARKHFTGTRSLGAGEMWMYHASAGGAGLRLTERRNDQQDAGEPALSPDGRHLYWSEDLTSNPVFQYNKDPHAGIYTIRRLDLETGRTENVTGGPGGAIRPTPSPDGETLAFVRRVRERTVLFLRDLESGAERPLWDGLSKDQQETWATFGVYPNFAWTPDGRALVIWAQGGLWRVDAASGAATAIPFRAEVRRTVHEAVRSPKEAHPERFTVRMIRDAETSPDGQTLAFNAVGSIWTRALPSGTPRQLSPEGQHAFFPTFSPDGRTVVYVGWTDEGAGHLYAVPAGGGTPRRLIARPGYYRTPRFSPDGRTLVFSRATGNGILGAVHGTEAGIYRMPAAGGEMTLVSRAGRDPRFDASGERVYFLDGFGIGKTYKSVRLDGGDERTHFNLQYVNAVVPSPDGRWVAFTDLHNVYIAPLPRTGRAVDLNRDTRALPVRRVTRDAGHSLHWSADSRTLHWTLGPEYFSKPLTDAFAFLEGAPEELPEPAERGLPIGLELASDVPTGAVAFTNARIVTMRGDEVIEGGTLVVSGNRIAAVGPSGEVTVPAGARVVDASGHTLMPGIVDVHAHVGTSGNGISPQQSWPYYANLAFGVTTAHDPSANTEMIFSEAEMLRAGRMVGPRLFSTGTILYGADGDFKAVINSLDDARSHLRRLNAVGAFSVKSYNQPRRNQRQQVLQAAREMDILVYPEGGSFFHHNVNMVVDGHTGIEHAVPVWPLYDDVIRLWAATEVGYTPTLVVGYGGLWGEEYWYQESNVWEHERLMRFTPRREVDGRAIRRTTFPEWDLNHVGLAETARRLVDAGGRVQLGAHGQLQGLAAHWELWMFGQGGMTPMQGLRAATLDGARYLGLDRDIGSLEPGKLADVLVIDGNPLENLRESERIRYVMMNGRLYDAASMDEVGPRERQRQPFWFEREGASDAAVWRSEAESVHALGCHGAH
jgi:imidazolonepropionase-like amidohydrolase/Tol biopolymer transport system component